MPVPPGPAPPRPELVAPRLLTELFERVSGVVWTGRNPAGVRLSGVSLNSRAVQPGDLYAALPGARAHGADFAAAAAAAGAVGVLTDPAGRDRAERTGLPVAVVSMPRAILGALAGEVYGRPAESLLLVGITGTNGKTTTSYLVEAALRAAGHRTGLIGTVETRVADEVLPSVRTTPEAPDVHALLAVMRERGVGAVAMEVSSHALVFGRVDGLRFDAAVFTNLSQDHLDFHGGMANYYAAKASLFTPERAAAAVINIDDPYGARLAAQASVPRVTVSPAGTAGADWVAAGVSVGPAASTFRLRGPGPTDVPAAVRLPGRFNVDNAALAIVAAVAVGVPPDRAAAGVAELSAVPGRMERIDAGQPFLAVVDYAHTPEAVEILLAALRPATAGRLLVVLGCGGDRDRDKRPRMGAAAVTGADLAIFTIDNPRSEDPAEILEAMLAGASAVLGAAPPRVEPDRAAAITLAVALAGPGDTVVVAGKGHEQGQEAGGVVVPFDDRSALRAALMAAGSAA